MITPEPSNAVEILAASDEHIAQYFAFAHLPPHLADVSRPFGRLAAAILEGLPRNPERTVALRKLLEAKDAAVRARLAAPPKRLTCDAQDDECTADDPRTCEVDWHRERALADAMSAADDRPATDDDVRGLLGLVVDDDRIDTLDLSAWSTEDREAVVAWAGAIHLRASDNPEVEIPPRPSVLPAWAGYNATGVPYRAPVAQADGAEPDDFSALTTGPGPTRPR